MSQLLIYNCYQCKAKTSSHFPVNYNIEKEFCIRCIKVNEKRLKKAEAIVKTIIKSKSIIQIDNNKHIGLQFIQNPIFSNKSNHTKIKINKK